MGYDASGIVVREEKKEDLPSDGIFAFIEKER
jgi:hypothetical protein